MGGRAGIETRLGEAFGKATPEHFAWQTEAPYVSERERELVRAAFLPLGERLLDVGCGEGATLHHLGAPASAVGLDLFEDKIAFARARLPRGRFVVGSAYELPAARASVDQVIVRDVVHHLEQPERFVDECARVLAPGGRVDVLEPCGYNPLVAMHALYLPAERAELGSNRAFLERLLSRRLRVVAVRHHQALPLHRVVFHPTFGLPSLARTRAARAVLGGLERLAERVVPRFAWAYVHVRAEV